MSFIYKKSQLIPVFALLICGIYLLSGCISARIPPTTNQILISQFEEYGLIAKQTERGVTVYLPNTFFVVGSSQLSDLAKGKVHYIADVCNESFVKHRRIVVEGHADSTGSEQDNLTLSKNRAENVSDLLANYNLDRDRIDATWFGETRPLVPNNFSDGTENPDGKRTNRRVEFIILDQS